MSPFGPYATFDECVAKNQDKSSPEGFCAWLEHKITGAWPGGMTADKWPEPYLKAYDAALVAGKAEKEAYREAIAAALAEGYEMTRFGFIKQFQAPNMKKITGVKVFAVGNWTDSAGVTRDWTNEDLDKMVDAFTAGVPAIVPLKCGHTSDAFNQQIADALGVPVETITGDNGQGQIGLGKMTSLERKGGLLVAAFENIPEPIANLIEGGQYATVSVEIEDAVGDFGPVITGVALLGAEEPAVDKATLERALIFGGSRKGARVLSFTVGEDIPIETLRAEFNEIRGKLADIIKGKRGAPIFRALFGNLANLFEQMVVGKHAAPGDNAGVPEEIRAYADLEYQGNIQPLIAWAGRVGFDACVTELTGKPGITDPERVCGWLKGQAESKPKGGNTDMLPKALEGKKPEDIRAMKLPDLVKLFEGSDTPTVEELKGAFQEGDLAAIAAALGLAEGATAEDIVAAIKALMEAAAAAESAKPGGEMAKEFAKASDRIKALEAEKAVRDWEDRTREFKAIPGTPHEHAVKLADIEGKAGKETAETQFKALEEANRLAVEAQKIVGTSRSAASPTDFDNEVAKYQSEHKEATKVEAIKAVSKARPDLYHARRDDWNQ